MNSKHRLVFADKERLEPKTEEMLKNFFEISHYEGNTSELKSHLKDGDFLWIRLDHLLDEYFFTDCPKIRCILTNTTGLTHIDGNIAKKNKISVINLSSEDKLLDKITSTSDHSIGLFYNLVRNINLSTYDVSKGNWDRSKFKGKQIDRFTLGIIGFGRVGKNINSQLKSSVNKILFYDNKAVNFPNKQRNLERSASLDDLLSNSDAIFICAKEQLNGESLINKHNIKNLKQGSYIINTSRGSLLEFDACYKALIEGRIAGLALDVLEGEESGILPKKSILESIYTHNLIITPHIAGNTKEAWELSEEIIAKKILKFVNK